MINTCFSYRMTVKKCIFQYNIISNKHRSQRINAGIDTEAPESGAGNAMGNIIFGDVSPSAKHSISMPRSAGPIRCRYNHKVSARGSRYKNPGSADALRRDFISDIKRGIYAYFAVFNGQKLSI